MELDTKSMTKASSVLQPDSTSGSISTPNTHSKSHTNPNANPKHNPNANNTDWNNVELPTGANGEIVWEKRTDAKNGRVSHYITMLLYYYFLCSYLLFTIVLLYCWLF